MWFSYCLFATQETGYQKPACSELLTYSSWMLQQRERIKTYFIKVRTYSDNPSDIRVALHWNTCDFAHSYSYLRVSFNGTRACMSSHFSSCLHSISVELRWRCVVCRWHVLHLGQRRSRTTERRWCCIESLGHHVIKCSYINKLSALEWVHCMWPLRGHYGCCVIFSYRIHRQKLQNLLLPIVLHSQWRTRLSKA